MTGPTRSTPGYTIPIKRMRTFVAVALHQGWDIDTILRDANIPPALLADGRSRVTSDQAAIVVRALWELTDDELLGFGPAPAPIGTFRLLASAMLSNAHTLGEMIERCQDFNRALPGTPPLIVTHHGHESTITFDLTMLERPVALLIDALLSVCHRVAEWAVGQQVPLLRVELPYPRPEEVDDYDPIFGAPIVFDAPAPALILDSRELLRPLLRTEADLDEFLARAPHDLLVRRNNGASFTDRVRRLMVRRKENQWPTAVELATALATSPQTLRRRLNDEGTSIRAIREDVLRDAAIESLARGQETVAALAQRLGFSEPSTFIRAFRRWTGSAPRSYQPRTAEDTEQRAGPTITQGRIS